MIERNRNPAGRLNNMGFGLCQLIDGVIRIASFGYLHTRLTLTFAKYSARRAIANTKRFP